MAVGGDAAGSVVARTARGDGLRAAAPRSHPRDGASRGTSATTVARPARSSALARLEPDMSTTYRSLLLFGPPGVGKGTQGARLGAEAGYVHLATGDIFRSLDKQTPEGQEFLKYSTQGLLVPDELTMRIWASHVKKMIAGGQYDPERDVLVLDGMPRSLEQAKALEDHIEPLGILSLVVPDEDEMVRRILKRGEASGRPDDLDEATIRRRFDEYREKTAPVLAHYDPALVHEIDGMGTIDEVFVRVKEAADKSRAGFLTEA